MSRKITGHTELIGLIATPIRHSKSPAMHNAAFEALGLDYVYLVFEVGKDELENTVKGLKAMKVRGWNVSMPNKAPIVQYLDKITPVAKMCGAVNTVINDDGILTGTITDGTGFMHSLKEKNIDIINKKITVVGVGGAATAICIQAAWDGVKEISIFNRKDDFFVRGEENVQKINNNTSCHATLYDLDDHEALKREINESVLFVNATNVGMGNLQGQMVLPDINYLNKDIIVYDVIYSPEETELLKQAKALGCKTLNGIGMMLYQGAEAFKLWTGKDMPIDVVKKELGIEVILSSRQFK
ncbi:MAG: shikimate dehydrogenase [Erysipelotrichaceae bacterium]|nr:shikimate dehydrogenase [Erysipelotrichaceae bacterium]